MQARTAVFVGCVQRAQHHDVDDEVRNPANNTEKIQKKKFLFKAVAVGLAL